MPHFFTDRLGGQSIGNYQSLNLGNHVGDDLLTVAANREIVSEKFGPTQYMNQVHGDEVILIESLVDPAPTCDALVTSTPGVTLAVMTADCIPLLLEGDGVIAAVHVGRKGLFNGVAIKTVELMQALGAEKISASIGPSICGSCYEVSQETHDEVTALYPSAKAFTKNATPALNLPGALTEVLLNLDIKVSDVGICTLESEEHFSYRKSAQTGRQAGLIWL